jgi:hypothetical protein
MSESDPLWRLATLGGLRTYGRGAPDRAWEILSEVSLPVTAARRPAGLVVVSPGVATLGVGPDGSVALASGPEQAGKSRLRSWLLAPEAPLTSRSSECWSKLPAPERVIDHAFFLLDGRPVLAVTTTPSDRLGLLAEKLLRVFPLGGDRTRAGVAPLFAAETRANLWQEVGFRAIDVNRDGRQDLVLSYWKGLKHGIAALDTYLRRPDGSFEPSPKRIELPVEEGDRSFLHYGTDLDGDDLADLMLVDRRMLLVFAGRSGKAIVAERPTLRAELPETLSRSDTVTTIGIGTGGVSRASAAGDLGHPHAIDLDHDGRSEVIFAGNQPDGRGRVLVVRF